MTDTIVLSTGRLFYGNNGIVGINGEGKLSTGYDNHLSVEDWNDERGDFDPWTKEDKIALADLMIERWAKWRNGIK